MNTVTLRRFREGDEFAVSDVICTILAISNRKDYSPAFIEEKIKSHSPEVIAARAKDAHFYVATDGAWPDICCFDRRTADFGIDELLYMEEK